MAAAPSTYPNNNSNNNALSTLLDSEIPSHALESTESNTESGIDSALQAALREPRERVALLRLEAAVVDFCKRPNDAWMEVGGPFNSVLAGPGPNALRSTAAQQEGRQTSFQRCIVHRLADRFGIVRETGSLLEGSIRLIKRADTNIPARLLQDLEPHEYGETTATATAAAGIGPQQRSLSQTSLNNSATGGTGSGKQPPRKMKIMKRSSNPASNTRSHTGSDKQKRTLRQSSSSSFSEKERAYAEARARIFNDESETQASNSGGDENPPLNEQSRSSSCERPGAATESLLKDLSSSSLENKAVYRNRMEEAADPDFRRCHPVMVSPSAMSSAYAQNAGVMMQQQQPPQIAPSYYPPPPPPPFAGLVPTQALQNQQQQQQQPYLRQQQQQLQQQQMQQHQQHQSSNFYSKFDSLSSTLPPMAVNAPAFYPSFARVAAASQQPMPYGTGVPGGPPPPSAPAATTTHASYASPAAALMKSSPSE